MLTFRWPPDLIERIDQARGDVPRSAWVRRAVEAALEPGETPPQTSAQRASAPSRQRPPQNWGRPNVRSSAEARAGVRPMPKR